MVTGANFRALWALLWFLAVYYLGPGRMIAARLSGPPTGWSVPAVTTLSPLLILWGLYCAWVLINQGQEDLLAVSAEEALFRSFPFVMMVAAVSARAAKRAVMITFSVVSPRSSARIRLHSHPAAATTGGITPFVPMIFAKKIVL